MAQGARARDDADALLHHPEVVRMVRAIMIVFRIAEQDLGDRIADVQERYLATTPPEERPRELPGVKALVRKVAYNVGREKVKELVRRGKYNKGATDAADEHAKSSASILEPHECATIREIVEQLIREEAAGKHTGAMLGDMMTGTPPRETAKDAGIPASQMRKKTSELRKLLKNRLVQAGIAVAALALVSWGGVEGVGAYNGYVEQKIAEDFAANSALPSGEPRRLEPPRFRDLPDVDKAPAYREKAAVDCASKNYEACENDLDMAKFFDPAGEQLPEVQALRKLLTQFDAKPRLRR